MFHIYLLTLCLYQVIQVSKSGPASEARMTPRAQGAFSERLCDWIITEIDGVPVSLLSKRDEVSLYDIFFF